MSYIHGTQSDEQRRLATLNRLINPIFLEFLQFGDVHSILEVGSGLGMLTREVASRAPAAEVVGVEQSPAQLAAIGEDLPPNLWFVKGDAHSLPFPDNRFDVVYCRFVLEHVHRPEVVCSEMLRVLAPGGRVFVMENDISLQRYDPPTPRFDILWGKVAQLQAALGGDALIGIKLFRLLTDAGFQDVSLSFAPDVYHWGEEEFDIWVDNEIVILQGCQKELLSNGLATREDIDQAIHELQSLHSCQTASTWFAWNRAAGRKSP